MERTWMFIEYFIVIMCGIGIFLKVIFELGYILEKVLSNIEKKRIGKELQKYYGKKQVLYYTLENYSEIDFLKNTIKSSNFKYNILDIQGIYEMNHKVIKHWDKNTELKIEYTIYENGYVETAILEKKGDIVWSKILHPQNLMDVMYNKFLVEAKPFNSWQLETVDVSRFKDKSSSANFFLLLSFIELIVYVFIKILIEEQFNIQNFIVANRYNILWIEYLIVGLLSTIMIVDNLLKK